MKPVWDQVGNQVTIRAYDQTNKVRGWKSIWDQVYDQVDRRVYDQVDRRVRRQVGITVRNQAYHQIRELL